MTNLKNRVGDNIKRLIRRYIRYETCVVDKVYWHKSPKDKDYNVVDVVMRDRANVVDDKFGYVRCRITSLMHQYVGKHFGHPWNPRRGDTVKVLFYQNWKGTIVSCEETKGQPPVCRPDPYTERDKKCQYRPMFQNDYKDFLSKTYQDGKKPTCTNWQHGPCNGDKTDGEPTIGRDWWHVWDYCMQGDEEPTCTDCVDIDYPKRDKNTWLKVYSDETMSNESPNNRAEFHTKCGSYLRFEQETGRSDEYSEGKAHIRFGNANNEDDKRWHLNVQGETVSDEAGVGTWDIHTNHEEVPLASESQGVRFAGVRPEDQQVDWAWEVINFPTNSYIRCYKSGIIVINSCSDGAVVTVDGTTSTITLDADLTHITGDVQIDGFCTHPDCTCHGS